MDRRDSCQLDIKMNVNTAATPGPTRDQSSAGAEAGGYAYIDSAWPRRPGDTARMKMSTSLVTEADKPMCLQGVAKMSIDNLSKSFNVKVQIYCPSCLHVH